MPCVRDGQRAGLKLGQSIAWAEPSFPETTGRNSAAMAFISAGGGASEVSDSSSGDALGRNPDVVLTVSPGPWFDGDAEWKSA